MQHLQNSCVFHAGFAQSTWLDGLDRCHGRMSCCNQPWLHVRVRGKSLYVSANIWTELEKEFVSLTFSWGTVRWTLGSRPWSLWRGCRPPPDWPPRSPHRHRRSVISWILTSCFWDPFMYLYISFLVLKIFIKSYKLSAFAMIQSYNTSRWCQCIHYEKRAFWIKIHIPLIKSSSEFCVSLPHLGRQTHPLEYLLHLNLWKTIFLSP